MVKRVGDKGEEGAVEGNAITTGSPLLLVMIILLHAANHLIGGALPVLYPAIMEEFDLGYVQLGFLRSASSFSAGFPQMFVGVLRRWISGRKLIGLGNLVHSVLNMAAGYVGSFQQFIALRVVAGIGGSPHHPVGTSMLTTNTHPSWRGRIFGIKLAAPTLASTLAPLIAAWLLLSLGWRATLTVLSVPALLASLVMLFVVKDNADADARSRSFSMRGLIDALRNRNVLALSLIHI